MDMSLFEMKNRKFLCCICTALVFFLTIPPKTGLAQTQVQDFEAPIIEHSPLEYSAEDEPQIFSATVADNVAVVSVLLLYRFSGEEQYRSVAMEPIASSSLYTASVSTNEAPGTNIEYYIQAEDEAGNVVFNGFAFAPVVRTLLRPVETVAHTIPVENTDSSIDEKPKSRVLYYVLGALAVGALAATLVDDDGTTNRPLSDADCPAGGCTVTFTLATP